jgi:hypothetical protein
MELLYDAGLVTRWAAKKIIAIKLWDWLMRLSENCYQDWSKNHKFNRNF